MASRSLAEKFASLHGQMTSSCSHVARACHVHSTHTAVREPQTDASRSLELHALAGEEGARFAVDGVRSSCVAVKRRALLIWIMSGGSSLG
eukprot:793085-Pleurochrysis_carterae.AAC.5